MSPTPHDHRIKALRRRLVEQAKRGVEEGLSGPDRHIIRAAQLSKSMESVFNLLYEQTLEWYGLHFPELRGKVKDPDTQLQMIIRLGLRPAYTDESLQSFFTDETTRIRIHEAAETSAGGSMEQSVLQTLQETARTAIRVREEYARLNEFVRKEMLELAPNFTQLATPVIAAQLLSKAGSFKRLSEMPGSTLQVLGAEEALFSHLRARTRPPKHGFIFNHPLLKTLPKHARGKMARALAGKLAICVRVDRFGKSAVWKDYHEKLLAQSKVLAQSKPKPKPHARTSTTSPHPNPSPIPRLERRGFRPRFREKR
ncbi:MAG: NOP5/NOP56 family protein [Candidatus Diapherotrites archaeon]|nr:NOP5/NOP56 family protein [Candidatus Diapherotrites archaeon]